MQIFNGVADAADTAREFYFTNMAALPEHVAAKIAPHVVTGSSPVTLVVNFAEATFANRGALPAPMLELAAGLADIIQANGYHGRLDGRAEGIMLALRRDSGESAPTGREWPIAVDDPAPQPGFEAATLAEGP